MSLLVGGLSRKLKTCKYLGNQGAHVTLVEMKDNIADGIGATFIGHMFAKLAEYQVDVKTSETVKEIKNHEVVYQIQLFHVIMLLLLLDINQEMNLQKNYLKKYDVKL